MVKPQNELAEKATLSKFEFSITPEKVKNAKDRSLIPNFKIDGSLESNNCSLNKSLNGEIMIKECKSKIKSIELQLIRVETCGCAEGYSKDCKGFFLTNALFFRLVFISYFKQLKYKIYR